MCVLKNGSRIGLSNHFLKSILNFVRICLPKKNERRSGGIERVRTGEKEMAEKRCQREKRNARETVKSGEGEKGEKE